MSPHDGTNPTAAATGTRGEFPTADGTRTPRGLRRVAALGAALLGLAACTGPGSDASSPARSAAAASPGANGTSVVAEDLQAPWSLAFHEGTALVSERDSARIREVTEDGTTHDVGVVGGVGGSGEGGLLGIAVRDGDLFAYSTGEGENRVERYELDGEPGNLTLGRGETILGGLAAASYHNGGRIAFGPDGMLYVTVGDAGDRSSAQDLTSLSGKILRIAPDGSIPGDNPFAGSAVWSYGHRNPQGIAWDEDGTLYASEFGQDTWDELNVIRPGGNYGWPIVEGTAGRDGFTDPVQQWAPDGASPSGIAVSDGAVHIANLRGQRLRDVPLDDLGRAAERLDGDYGRLRDVVVAPDGSLWVLTGNTDGRGRPAAGDDRIIRVAGR